MHLHILCVGGLAPAPEDYRCPYHGVADDPQLVAPQAPARQRAFIQPCLDHLVPATGVQEGEREEILARSFSLLKPQRCLANLFSHPILPIKGPRSSGTSFVASRSPGALSGRDSLSASGAPENCRLRLAFSLLLVFSGIVGDLPGGPAAQDLDGPLELLGGDLAPGEALPEDLLRRVPGRLRSLGPANLREDAHHQPRYDGHKPAQKQNE